MSMPKKLTRSGLNRIRAVNSIGKVALKPAKLLKGFQPKRKPKPNGKKYRPSQRGGYRK